MAIFMNMSGIAGDSLDQQHRGWIDIDELSHSIVRGAPEGRSAGRSRGSVAADAFVLAKGVDLSSIKLQEAVATGLAVKSVTIDVTRRTSDGEAVYLTYELKDCSVRSWELQATENGIATEEITLDFVELKTIFTPTAASGRSGSPVDFAWNFAKSERA